jgi:hypothetical protein
MKKLIFALLLSTGCGSAFAALRVAGIEAHGE